MSGQVFRSAVFPDYFFLFVFLFTTLPTPGAKPTKLVTPSGGIKCTLNDNPTVGNSEFHPSLATMLCNHLAMATKPINPPLPNLCRVSKANSN